MTNEQLIHTVKEAMRNDTVLNKGMVELLCDALVTVTEQRDALVAELSEVKKQNSEIMKHVYRSKSYLDNNRAVDAAMGLSCAIEVKQRKTPHDDAAIAALRAEVLQGYADSIAIRLKDKELSIRQKERLNFTWAEVKAYMAEQHNRQLRESKGASHE